MESFLLGFFSDYLSQFIIGFRKEQVTANLLTGKGEITNTRVNVKEINALLPGPICFDSISVGAIAINVQSFTNIKVIPIRIVVKNVKAVIVERIEFNDISNDKNDNTNSANASSGLAGPHKYGLLDRVLDNISIELQNVNISFHTMGKFKTKYTGMHTPPILHFELPQLSLFSVDQFGEPLKEKWPKVDGKIVIFKKVALVMKVLLEKCNCNDATGKSTTKVLLKETPCELDLNLTKITATSALLGVSTQLLFENIEVLFDNDDATRYLLEFIFGIIFCIIKDRSFIDPLVSLLDINTKNESPDVSSPVVTSDKSSDDGEINAKNISIGNDEINDLAKGSISFSSDINETSKSLDKNSSDSQNASYFEDWFTSSSAASSATSVPTISTPTSSNTSISCSIIIQSFSFRLCLHESDHLQLNIRNLYLHSKIPTSPFAMSFVFCNIIYREAENHVVPLLLIPTVPATLLCPNDTLSPMFEISLSAHQGGGYGLSGSIQSCNLTLDIEVALKFLQFAYRIFDSRWLSGNWIEALPVKLKSHEPYCQPLVLPKMDSASLLCLLKRVDVDFNDILVVLRREFDGLLVSAGGRIKYRDENVGANPMENTEPRNISVNVSASAAIESKSNNFYSQLLESTSFALKVNLSDSLAPLISISSKDSLIFRLSSESAMLCFDTYKSQYDLISSYKGKRLALIDFPSLISKSKEFVLCSNIILNFNKIELFLPFVSGAVDDFSINKSGSKSFLVHVQSAYIINQAFKVSGIKLNLVHVEDQYRGSVNIDDACLDVDKIQDLVKGDVSNRLFKQNIGVTFNSIDVLISTRDFTTLTVTASLICLISDDDNNPISEIPLQLNDMFVEIPRIIQLLPSSNPNPRQTEKSRRVAIWDDLKSHIQKIKINMNDVINEVHSDIVQRERNILELERQKSFLEAQKVTNLLLLSNDHAGYLQVGVKYADYLQRFFCIVRRGVLYIYKDCGQQTKMPPFKVYPLALHDLFGANPLAPRGFILKPRNNDNEQHYLIMVASTVQDYKIWVDVLSQGILMGDILNGTISRRKEPQLIKMKCGDEFQGIEYEDEADIARPQTQVTKFGSKLSDGVNKFGARMRKEIKQINNSARELELHEKVSTNKVDGISHSNNINSDCEPPVAGGSNMKLKFTEAAKKAKERMKIPLGKSGDDIDEKSIQGLSKHVSEEADTNSLDESQLSNAKPRIGTKFTLMAKSANEKVKKIRANSSDFVVKESEITRKQDTAMDHDNKIPTTIGDKFSRMAKAANEKVKKIRSEGADDELVEAQATLDETETNNITEVYESTNDSIDKSTFGEKFSKMAKSANERVKKIRNDKNEVEIGYTSSINFPRDPVAPGIAIQLKSIKLRNFEIEDLDEGKQPRPGPIELCPSINGYTVTSSELITRTVSTNVKPDENIALRPTAPSIQDENDCNIVTQKLPIEQLSCEKVVHDIVLNIYLKEDNGQDNPQERLIRRSVDELISLHSTASLSIEDIHQYRMWMLINCPSDLSEDEFQEFKQDLIDGHKRSPLGLSSFGHLRLCSKLLLNLLEPISKVKDQGFNLYFGDVLLEYLNALIHNPLPQRLRNKLSAFLEIGASDISMSLSQEVVNDSQLIYNLSQPYSSTFFNNFSKPNISTSISTVMESAMYAGAIVDSFAMQNEEVDQDVTDNCAQTSERMIENRSPYYDTSLLLAFKKALIERDESHAQIVASSVLHVHDLEQERKTVDKLKKKLTITEKLLFETEAIASASYFQTDTAGLAALQKRKKEELKELQNSFLQNNDDELMSLCRQLASEIEARTSATLEVNRLKELHEHERTILSSENDFLRQELEAAKKALDKERKKCAQLEAEAKSWKYAFQGLSLDKS